MDILCIDRKIQAKTWQTLEYTLRKQKGYFNPSLLKKKKKFHTVCP